MEGVIKRQLTEKEYRNLGNISSSDVRLFLSNRKKFVKKMNGEIVDDDDEYKKGTLIGSLVHTLLLEKENFDAKYYMSICAAPPSANLLKFTEALYKHTVEAMDENGVITKDFAELCELAYPESEYKITLEAVLKKFVGTEAEMYYKQLREARTRNLCVVCADDLAISEKVVKITEEDDFNAYVLQQEGWNELKIEDFELAGVRLKAMLDKVVRDDAYKTLQIVDIKVLYDNQNFYRDYYKKRMGWIQISIYQAALIFARDSGLLGEEYKDYEILEPAYLVLDSSCFYAPLLYTLSSEELDQAWFGWEENGQKFIGTKEALEEIKWATENGIWNIPKKDYENKGIKKLK